MTDIPTGALAASRRFWWALWIGLVLGALVYVGQRWSPSSYAIVLQELQVENTGLVAGMPRPERGDEFAWQTPLLQMTVRSGFQRFDRTPPYFEDLRGLYAMPIVDWALVFKPQFWMFFVAPPDFAYSFYHFLLIAMFVVGFTLLFMRLCGRAWPALFMALALFFASYTQYWWDGASNFFFPFFPWIVLAPLWPMRFAFRVALLFWLLTCALLTYFYPPNAISLGFAAAVLWAVLSPDLFHWRRMVPLVAAAGTAGGIVLFYLRDAIATLTQTVYPGHRVSAGGDLHLSVWLSQFLPTSLMNHHIPVGSTSNICELSTIGSVYVLALVFFLPWRSLIVESSREERRRWALLGAALVATQSWMIVTLPSWVGYPLLWHLVPSGRMVLAGGVLLMILALVLGTARPLRFDFYRCVAFALTLVLGWAVFKLPHEIGFREAFRDWIYIVPVVVAALAQGLRILAPPQANGLLIASAAALAFVSFATFNPIQKTTPLFQKHDTKVTRELDRRLREEGRGYLAIPFRSSFFGHSGLPLIGLGYPSMAYSTFDPPMEIWRKLYPEMPRSRVRAVFQNAGAIGFDDVPEAKWVPIFTVAPIEPLRRPGLTVCDLIRSNRAPFAASIGCPAPAPAPAATGVR